MKVIKLVLTVIDHDGLGVDDVCDMIVNARYPNHCIAPHVLSTEVRDIGEWSDDNPLNKRDKIDAEIHRLFDSA